MYRPNPLARRPRLGGPLLAISMTVAFVTGCSTSAGPTLSTPAAAATGAAATGAAAPTGATGNGAVPKDLCGLLTPAEIGAAVGYSVASGKLNASGNACLWQGQTAIGVQLVVGTGGEAAFKDMAAFPLSGGSQPISGIGDEAAQATGAEAVVFRKGDVVVTINASDATTGAAAVLAKLVAPRL
jgi:hypothetical protein